MFFKILFLFCLTKHMIFVFIKSLLVNCLHIWESAKDIKDIFVEFNISSSFSSTPSSQVLYLYLTRLLAQLLIGFFLHLSSHNNSLYCWRRHDSRLVKGGARKAKFCGDCGFDSRSQRLMPLDRVTRRINLTSDLILPS